MPPRKNRRRNDEDEQLDKQQKNSKWANILNNEEDEATELYKKPKKEIFNFDFSKEHLLLNQKEPVKKQQPKVVLTRKQQQELDKRLAKEKFEKEEKQKIRTEKHMERKKTIEKKKQEEQTKKEEDQKKQQELDKIVKSNKTTGDTKKIMYFILFVLIGLGTLQYQKDIYIRLSKFRIDSQINYYEVLETSNGASDAELKTQYKKLVLKYHPDKNPNCHTCKQKFDEIMTAWEVLGNSEKRQNYDQNSGFIKQIHSESVTLTTDNYDKLLGDSDEIWIVQVYDSTNPYCHYFSQFWEEVISHRKEYIKFGRIDVWQQSQMKSYIPYNYQLFPGLYSIHQGDEKLCQVNFQNPINSIELCIEQRISSIKYTKIKDYEQIKQSTKIPLIISSKIKLSSILKLIHTNYDRYYDYYIIKSNQASVKVKGTDNEFKFINENTKQIYDSYSRFLMGNTVQQKTICQIHYSYKNTPCILLIEEDYKYFELFPYPVIRIKESRQFNEKIKLIKNMTGLNERFELGLYQDGKLDFGNFDEINSLNPENGEVIDFKCTRTSWFKAIFQFALRLKDQI